MNHWTSMTFIFLSGVNNYHGLGEQTSSGGSKAHDIAFWLESMKLGMMTHWTLGNKSRTRPILTLTPVTSKFKMAIKILTFYPLTALIFGLRA